MSDSPSPLQRSAIIARLRAAGSVFAEDEAQLLMAAAQTSADLAAMVEKRTTGMPLEHILGWAAFCGLRIHVEPGVFVPRGRTELLVREAVALCRPGAVVVDLCCGSGAVGTALAASVPLVELHATDISPAAVRCARRNLGGLGGQVFEGDLFEPLPARLRGAIDVVVANAPYVPSDAIRTMPPEARLYEPHVALDGGTDGLAIQRRVAAGAPFWLTPGGSLLVETSERQAAQSAELLARNGLLPRVVRSDELDATVVIGTKPQ